MGNRLIRQLKTCLPGNVIPIAELLSQRCDDEAVDALIYLANGVKAFRFSMSWLGAKRFFIAEEQLKAIEILGNTNSYSAYVFLDLLSKHKCYEITGNAIEGSDMYSGIPSYEYEFHMYYHPFARGGLERNLLYRFFDPSIWRDENFIPHEILNSPTFNTIMDAKEKISKNIKDIKERERVEKRFLGLGVKDCTPHYHNSYGWTHITEPPIHRS